MGKGKTMISNELLKQKAFSLALQDVRDFHKDHDLALYISELLLIVAKTDHELMQEIKDHQI